MQSPSSLSAVQQFILDCAELASILDNLDPGGYRHELLSAVLHGQAEYHALLQRRQDLSPSDAETVWVDFMLDALLARLSYLEGRIGVRGPGIRKPPAWHVAPRESC